MRKNCALNKMYLESIANATYSASGADFSNVAVIGQRGRGSKSSLLALLSFAMSPRCFARLHFNKMEHIFFLKKMSGDLRFLGLFCCFPKLANSFLEANTDSMIVLPQRNYNIENSIVFIITDVFPEITMSGVD